jgi:hypothetical protein
MPASASVSPSSSIVTAVGLAFPFWVWGGLNTQFGVKDQRRHLRRLYLSRLRLTSWSSLRSAVFKWLLLADCFKFNSNVTCDKLDLNKLQTPTVNPNRESNRESNREQLSVDKIDKIRSGLIGAIDKTGRSDTINQIRSSESGCDKEMLHMDHLT